MDGRSSCLPRLEVGSPAAVGPKVCCWFGLHTKLARKWDRKSRRGQPSHSDGRRKGPARAGVQPYFHLQEEIEWPKVSPNLTARLRGRGEEGGDDGSTEECKPEPIRRHNMLPSLFVAVPLMGAGAGDGGIHTIRSILSSRLSRSHLSGYAPSNLECAGTAAAAEGSSKWRRRTERRRQRTEELIQSISDGGLAPSLLLARADDVDVPALAFPTIDWERHSAFDPIIPGKEVRGLRKRAQVEAFYHVLTDILDSIYAEEGDVKTIIIDAGCGAGNLALGIAGLLADADSDYRNRSVEVLAVDTNERALDRLSARSVLLDLPPGMLRTCCADLADSELIRSRIEDSCDVRYRTVVVSLHAGSRLRVQRRAVRALPVLHGQVAHCEGSGRRHGPERLVPTQRGDVRHNISPLLVAPVEAVGATPRGKL